MRRGSGPQSLNTFDAAGDDIPLHSARAWAESTLRLVEAAQLSRERLSRTRETMPSEWDEITYPPLQRAFREVWTTECMLVLSASQLEKWIARLYRDRNRRAPQPLVSLKHLRNAIEHADEAEFDEQRFVALPRNPQSWSRGIGRLPGGEFSFAADGVALFGVIDPAELEGIARALITELVDEAHDWVQDITAWSLRLLNR